MRLRAIGILAALLLALVVWVRLGPLPSGLLNTSQVESTRLLDRHGELLYESRGDSGTRSVWLQSDRLPPVIVQATVAAEDHRFWHHPGIDPIALVRAALRDLRHQRILEGGSTITQQTAKLLLEREGIRRHGIVSKAHEALVALRLEHRFTKRQILALYLNLAAYGNGITGAERAGQAYFNRDAIELTVAQAAFLAALPQRPSTFNPYHDPTRARHRQERVLVQMALRGYLSPDGLTEALAERLTFVKEPAPFIAPHFVARVIASRASRASGASTAGTGSHEIATTLDARLQRTIRGIIEAERSALSRIGAHNVAVLVLDNKTGEWLGWEGSGNYGDAANGGAIDGATTPRQPGSALKPFTYAAAFEDGASPATVLPDVPSFFPTAQPGVLYGPRNYDNQFRGPLLARRALAGSENVPAVALASRVGVPALLRFLRNAGFTTFDKNAAFYGLGLTLGDAEVRLDELVAAYAVFANGGIRIAPRLVRAPAEQVPATDQRLISPRTAFWITDILSDDEARAYAFGRGGSLEFPFKVAAKTGTSQAYRDNWVVGYTRDVTVGVWVGNFDRRPLIASSGVSGAGPIFHAVMLAAATLASGGLPAPDDWSTPRGTTRTTICALSGLPASPWCPSQIDEWVAAGEPASSEICTWHVPAEGGSRVRWPAEYLTWARAGHLVDRITPVSARLAAVTPERPVVSRHDPPRALRVLSPPDGAIYLIDPTLRREFQTLPLRAAADGDDEDRARIEWRIDGHPVGESAGGTSVDWPLAVGRHIVTARDPAAPREAHVSILVK